MMIQVTYDDETFDYVKDFMLDALIESKKITRFRRTSGWVDVADGEIRRAQPGGNYHGRERRSNTDRRMLTRAGEDRRNYLWMSDDRVNSSQTDSTMT